jgi:tetratricopeptide (TPR) repeat protein/type II secretory pathway predicted ATPase ExeA
MSPPAEPAATRVTPAAGLALSGRYTLLALIGRGGMGEVWRARDRQLARDVAVKLPAADRIADTERSRLLDEARLAASINHPGVVAVYDAGDSGGQPFVVFELVEGRSLRERPLANEAAARRLAEQVLESLEVVHGLGIVHRDLKPENLLWTDGEDDARIKLADLGIARLGTETTRTHAIVMGTAAYLAPEQALGGAIDGRADLYALGVVLYEAIAGRTPFEGADALAVISQHLNAPVPPLRLHAPTVDPGFERFVLRLLQKAPDDRFAGAREAREALASLESDGAPAHAGDGAPLDQLVRGRLVGRAAELERLRGVWHSAVQENARLALVSGEPGIGKTRLAREVVTLARMEGAAVLAGGCYEFEATTPYLPFVEAVSKWARGTDSEALRAALGDAAPELARLVPEIDARLGPFPAAAALQPHEERLRLFEAVTRVLRGLAGERGLLVWLDDLHWADTGTLSLLRHLIRQLRGDRVLLLGTYREVELDRRHPLAAALVEWDRERIATRVALSRLDRAETDALLSTLLHQSGVTDDFGAAMHRETEGNPFFVEEVVKALIDQGQIYREGGEWQRGAIEDMAIPQSVKDAIGRRLDRLGEGCAGVLHLAAVIGKTFEFPVLFACAGLSDDALLDALDEASAAQLVQSLERETFAFTHDKIREVLVEELNPIRLRRLHLKVADVLRQRPGARPEDLSYHYLHAGELAAALEWSLAAAVRANAVCALDEASTCLERARECADALGDRAQRLDVLARMVDVHSRRGDLRGCVDACRAALALSETPAERVHWNVRAGEMCVRHGDRGGDAFLDAAERDLETGSQSGDMVLLRTSRARMHHYRTEHTRAIEILTELLAMPACADDPHNFQLACSYMAGAYQHLSRYEDSMVWARRCIEVGTTLGDEQMMAVGHEFMAEDLSSWGRSREALEHAREDLRLGQRTGSLDRQAWAHWCLSFAHGRMGDLALALEHCRASIRICDQLGEKRLWALQAGLVAGFAAEAGDDAFADELLRDGTEKSRDVSQPVILSELSRGRGNVALARGDGPGALAAGQACLRLREGSENVLARDAHLALTALGSLMCGDLPAAETMANECLAFSDRMNVTFARAEAHRVLAAVTRARGDAAGARHHLDLAVASSDEAGARLDLARALGARAALHREQGDAVRAAADHARAVALAEGCGAARILAELRLG